jgi:glycosyltransferase involved in cell wall biosynthesis
VLPSRWEGWSSALTEAAVVGCPIVVSEGALAGADWLKPGESALRVANGDVDGLCRALHELLQDAGLRARLSRAAAAAAERYDYRSVAAEYERFALGRRLRAQQGDALP